MKTEQSPPWQSKRLSYNSLKTVYWLLVIIIAFNTQSAIAEETDTDKLPSDSQYLVDRLAEYEQREKDKLKKTLDKKRGEVLTILKKHFKSRTKNGQLDQALAIRKKINQIEALLPQPIPKRLFATNKTYVHNGQPLSPEKLGISSKSPVFFSVDGNDGQGKIILNFKHPQIDKMFNSSKAVYLELQIADRNQADTVDSVVVKYNGRIIGKKLGPKQGEKVKIKLESWKVTPRRSSITLTIENSGPDAFNVQVNNKVDNVSLLFNH